MAYHRSRARPHFPQCHTLVHEEETRSLPVCRSPPQAQEERALRTSRKSLALIGLIASEPLLATTSLTGGAGAVIGHFATDEGTRLTQGYQLSLLGSWHPSFAPPWALSLQVRQLKLRYEEAGVRKQATYNLAGSQLSFLHAWTRTLSTQFCLDYFPFADLSVLSSHSVLLNDRRFRYATWERHRGPAAQGFHLRFNYDKIDGQFSPRNRYRTGIGVSLVQQALRDQETEITTSSDTLEPETRFDQRAVSYRLDLLSLELLIGLTF